MAAPIVYQDVSENIELQKVGQLFAGKKFWVARRVPGRNRLLDDIKANGGEIVLLEKKADYLIADHFRRDCPPGSTSYEFVQKSIKEGRLRDPEDHRAGPPSGALREPGDLSRPAKGNRTPFTTEEDNILYKWVRDFEKQGGAISGNEIYKQLEAKYPRHTFQSWRDRYLKQLRHRPPSTFNIPNNAPPSPPSDNAVEQRPRPQPLSKQTQSSVPPKEQPRSTKVVENSKSTVKSNVVESYSLEQLAATFTSKDWEEVYANVDVIDSCSGQAYCDAWASWAGAQGNQTAEQWRQYYEKVVRPQWLRDPEWKREQIMRKVEERHNEISSQSLSTGVQPRNEENSRQDEHVVAGPSEQNAQGQAVKSPKAKALEDESSENERRQQLLEARRVKDNDAAAYVIYARQNKRSTWNAHPSLDDTNLHRLLMSKWESFTELQKAPYIAMSESSEKRAKDEVTRLEAETKALSSSTVQYETPEYISAIYQNTLKRVRPDTHSAVPAEQSQAARPTKRRKSTSPVGNEERPVQEPMGTQALPVEISSSQSSITTSRSGTHILQGIEQMGSMNDMASDDARSLPDNERQIMADAERIELGDLPDMDRFEPPHREHDQFSEDELPSNTPTPRASRQIANNFDTQAILSSPSQDLILSRLPRPLAYTQGTQVMTGDRSSSLAPHPSSDASTTHSLEEFRRSLNGEDTQVTYPTLNHLPRPTTFSPVPSTASSDTDSGDPDPPLSASEFDEFFDEKLAEGYPNEFVTKALKRTRFRPGLTEIVLEAWAQGEALPDQRGIWSLEDDEAAESGDGLALAKLQRKHTLDGWGGITERLIFLEGYRSR